MGRFDALLSIESKKEEKRAQSASQATGLVTTQKRVATPLPEAPKEPRAKSPVGQANQGIPVRPNARTPVRPNGRRIITRNAFELYEDQMDSLRKLAMDEKLDGRLGSMSAMVREAIDTFLKEAAANKSA